MQQVRCTNCGSAAIVPDGSGEFCVCEACGSTFCVPRALEFSKVTLDRTQDVRAWREYLAKQLRLQQESSKSRDYRGVELFAQKILSVLPDDFRANYYLALAERNADNDTAYTAFLNRTDFTAVTDDEKREVVESAVSTVEPKYVDAVKNFVAAAYPDTHANYDAAIERNIKSYIQKLRYAKSDTRDVFICHRTAAPDQDVADAICTRLEERGLRCWIAPRNILAGSQNYDRDIIKGVENCRLFLFVSSFKSIYSDDCETELKAAVLAGKALYSYRIDDTEYDGAFLRALEKVQWLDATDDPYAHLEQLVIDIKGLLAEDEREKAELEEKRLAAREAERLESEAARARDKARLDRLERILSGGAPMSPPVNLGSRLKRAEIEVQSGNFDRARDIADDALDLDPENARCWWLLLLCDYKVRSDAELIALDVDFSVNANYRNAERFADAEMSKRIDRATENYRLKTIKAVGTAIDAAERDFAAEDFKRMAETLDAVRSAFRDENGLIFVKFPDIASKYFWLRLWSKYGQTPLVCVEDITRETEYKTAMRYATAAQAREYEKTRHTVTRNAEMFLRERSKDPRNDAKLVDYLVDNKNILPPEIYNKYSSLMYFRKMLSSLNTTEDKLKTSTTDIATNEYFMLACSLATDSQKQEYDALVETIEKNRQRKVDAETEKQKREEAEKKRIADRERRTEYVTRTVFIVSAAIAYIMLVSTLSMVWFVPGAALGFLIPAIIARIVNDAMCYARKDKKLSRLFLRANFISSLPTVIAMIAAHTNGYGAGTVLPLLIAAVIVEFVFSNKIKSNKQDK